jgi:hypothetical protein
LSTAAPAGCPSPTGAGGMSAALASVAAITNTVEITHRDGPCHPLYPHTDRPRMAPGGVPKQRTHRRRCDQFAICVLQSAHDRPGLAAAAAACPSRLLTSNPLGLNASWPRSHKRHGGSAAEHRTGRPRPPTPAEVVPWARHFQPTSFGVLTYAKRLQLPPGSLAIFRD